MKYQTILFDLDGTLTDPGEGITRSVAYALESFGIHVPDRKVLYPFIGPPLLDSFMEFYGFSEKDARQAIEKYREYFGKQGIFENELYSGVPEALEELKKKYPERKIYAVDTLGASLGEGLLVYHAANLREAGESIEAVNGWLLENRLHLCHWFTVDDLFFLQRGGRVSGTVAIFGTLLNVKPVMHMDNEGRLIFVTKVRGRKRSLDALVERLDQTAINPSEQSIFITHGDCLEDAQYVAKKIEEKYHPKEIVINWVDPVIGAHSGPGTVALFFLGTER